MIRLVKILACLLVLLLGLAASLQATEARLGPPPSAPQDLKSLELSPTERAAILSERQLSGPLSVNPQNREASRQFYLTVYLGSGSQAINWTGNRATCNAGDTALDFKEAVAQRINYFRAMAGVPAGIVLATTYNQKDQKTALMMSVNGALNHNPPPSWTCYTAEGAEGAQNSNLALGAYGWDAISLYIKDPGASNSAVGHRRWLLYPQTQEMGTGDIPETGGWAANAVWVFDAHIWDPRPSTREEFVAWPPPGYVPYQVVYPRWSFAYPEADFSQATVTMTENQQPITVTLAPIVTGYGENTLVWIPKGLADNASWPQPSADTRYRVNITNVRIGGNYRNFSYEVIVFDPATAGPASSPLSPLYLLLLGN